MKQERGQITREKGVVSKRRRLGEQGGAGHLFLQEGKARRPAQSNLLPAMVSSERAKRQWIQSACCLPHCVHPATAGTHPASPGHRYCRDSTHSLCLPLPAPKRGTDVSRQQISQAVKLHRPLPGTIPSWRLDDPRPSVFRIIAKLEELESATRPMCRWDH